MSHRLLLTLIVMASGCATESTTPTGRVASAQDSYNQSLEKCQEQYRGDISTDAGMGATQTKDDADFSNCLAQAKTNLDLQMRQAQSVDAGSGS